MLAVQDVPTLVGAVSDMLDGSRRSLARLASVLEALLSLQQEDL